MFDAYTRRDTKNFNSIKVRLEQLSAINSYGEYAHFNSIKVRLERDYGNVL